MSRRRRDYRPAGWLRYPEVAEKLGCSIQSAIARVHCSTLTGHYVRGEPMVHVRDLAKYQKELRRKQRGGR